MKHALYTTFCFSMIIISAQSAFSLPRFALLTGSQCQSCHVDPTGGRMRNLFGFNYGKDELPIRATRDKDFEVSPNITENISIGVDFRTQFIYDGFSKKTSFQAMSGALYGSIKLGKKLTFYYKQDIINNRYGALDNALYSGPEVFGMARILPGDWYIKAGIFLPNYGWRIDDHTAYTRGGNLGFVAGLPFSYGLIFVPNYKDIGIEFGGSLADFFVTAAVVNGTGNIKPIDFSKDKAFVGRVEYVAKISNLSFRFGGSYYYYKTSDFFNRLNSASYEMGGFTAGFGYEDVVVLGEIDWTKNRLVPRFGASDINYAVQKGLKAMAASGEVDIRATDGLWIIGRYDAFDPVQGISNNQVERWTLGLEFFPYSFVEVRPQYRINSETPSIDNDEFLVQFHFWF